MCSRPSRTLRRDQQGVDDMLNWFLTRDEAIHIAYTVNETEEFPADLISECREALARATKQFDGARAAAYTPRRDYLYETMREELEYMDASAKEKIAAVRSMIRKINGEDAPDPAEDYLGAATGRLADVLASLNIDNAKFNRFIHFAFEGNGDEAADILLSDTEKQRTKNCAAILALARIGYFSQIRQDVTADEIAVMLVYSDGYRALQKAERAGEIAAGTAKTVVNAGLLAMCILCYIGILTLGFMAMQANVVLGVIVMMALWLGGTIPLIALDDQENTVQGLADKLSPVLNRIGVALGSRELAKLDKDDVTVQATVSEYESAEIQQVQAAVTG